MQNLGLIEPAIARVCESLPVKRLGLFGSVLTKEFTPESDIDVLVVFDPDAQTDLFVAYFELKERLQAILGREVDLTVDRPFRNPVFREAVEKTRLIVYER